MAPRAYWKGYLRLSLVSCPIQLFPATSEREKIRFHQINKNTGNRIKYCKVDAVTGEQVNNENIVMGYEVSKGEPTLSEKPEGTFAKFGSEGAQVKTSPLQYPLPVPVVSIS